MNKFKLFKSGDDWSEGFIIQLNNCPVQGKTFWWIEDLHCGGELDIPKDLVGWADGGEVGEFIGYITFKKGF